MLQYQEHRDKDQCLQGVIHKDKECTQEAANKCTHKRNQRSHSNKHADQWNIGHFKDAHRNRKQAAENHSFQTLSGNEIRKSGIGQAKDTNRFVAEMLRQNGIQNSSSLPCKDFLTGKTVQSEDKSNHQINKCACNTTNRRICTGGNHRNTVLEHRSNFLNQTAPVKALQICCIREPLQKLRIRLEKFKKVGLHPQCKINQFRNQQLNGFSDLRHQQLNNSRNCKYDQHQCQYNCYCTAQALILNYLQRLFNDTHWYIQDKGNGCTQNKGREHTCQGSP